MSLTRRQFVETASIALLVGAANPRAFAQDSLTSKGGIFNPEDMDVLAGVSEETFKPLVGDSFSVSVAEKRLASLKLVSVSAATSPALASETRSVVSNRPGAHNSSKVSAQSTSGFSLHFKGKGKSLAQGTYTFENERVGRFPLFIVMGGPGMNPNTYTAVFCQLVS